MPLLGGQALMGQLLLVRHGQASWGAEDYDVLSPVGRGAVRAPRPRARPPLGDVEPDVLVHGTMRRQRRTAELAAKAAGWSVTPTVDERWNEIDHLAVLAAQPQEFEGEPDRAQFQAWFEAATERWTSGDHDDDYDESFPAFRARVRDGARRRSRRSGTAVVVTSGGPDLRGHRRPARGRRRRRTSAWPRSWSTPRSPGWSPAGAA